MLTVLLLNNDNFKIALCDIKISIWRYYVN